LPVYYYNASGLDKQFKQIFLTLKCIIANKFAAQISFTIVLINFLTKYQTKSIKNNLIIQVATKAPRHTDNYARQR